MAFKISHFCVYFTSALLVVLFCASSPAHADEEGGGGEHYYDGGECEHEHFYCDYDDPSMFYRCIDGVYYTFQCPSGLHFSSKQQTCDWPHLADCAGGGETSESGSDYGGGDEGGSYYEDSAHYDAPAAHAEASGSSSSSSSGSSSHSSNDWSQASGDLKISTWINQPAAGKPWWRPAGVDPKEWHDVSKLKTPDYAVHIPDDPKDDEESEKPKKKPKKKGGKKSAGVSKTSSVSQPSPKIERQNSGSLQWGGGECSPSNCQLPSCYCPGTAIPNNMPVSSVPQMVMLTFDDEVSAAFYGYYQRLFRPGRYNPNGCPVRGCLFVSGSGTTYDLVYPLYALGVEIASHSVSHRFPHTWWSGASYKDFVDEAKGMRDNLINQAGVPRSAIKGFRVPFLQLGSDNMYSALYDSGFEYDTSMFTGSQWEGSHAPVWPFTLDYVPSVDYCQHGPCPKKQYPGMWEIPVQRWYGLDGHSCAMPDGCSATGDAEETLEYLKSNFRRYYNSNRAPFGIFVHARWFSTEHTLDGLDRFLDYLLTLDDVYIVTPSQVVEWMKKPTPLSGINGFEPWSCQGGANDVWLEAKK